MIFEETTDMTWNRAQKAGQLVSSTLLGMLLCAAGAQAQMYKFHQADVGVAAAGQFTTSITSQTNGSAGEPLTQESTTDSPGVLFTVRDHPVSWAGVELNYQYTKLSERFRSPVGGFGPVFLPTSFHEASAAYLFHVNLHVVKPYVGIGGGAIDFVPTTEGANQWRGTGLFDTGVDLQTHSSLGFRFGGRGLFYRAPNFYNSTLASSRWVATEEPYGGVYVKF
jgi:hypothetical protein